MGSWACLQHANSKIYRENFPPARINFLQGYKVWNWNHFDPHVCSSWLTFFAHCAVEIRLEHFYMAFLHCPYQVDGFTLLKCLNSTSLAWDMRLKKLKFGWLAHIFAHCAVKKRLEHFSIASLDCPYQVDDFSLLKCLNLTFLAWDMMLKWHSKIVERKKIFPSLTPSLHWLGDGHKNFSISTFLAKVIKFQS